MILKALEITWPSNPSEKSLSEETIGDYAGTLGINKTNNCMVDLESWN